MGSGKPSGTEIKSPFQHLIHLGPVREVVLINNYVNLLGNIQGNISDKFEKKPLVAELNAKN